VRDGLSPRPFLLVMPAKAEGALQQTEGGTTSVVTDAKSDRAMGALLQWLSLQQKGAVSPPPSSKNENPVAYPCLRKYNQAMIARITAGNRFAINGGTP